MKSLIINARTGQPVQPWEMPMGIALTPQNVQVTMVPGDDGVPTTGLLITVDPLDQAAQPVHHSPQAFR